MAFHWSNLNYFKINECTVNEISIPPNPGTGLP